jgi:Pyridoxamine 5'-phosphate oxidase
MQQQEIADMMGQPISQDLLASGIPARFAYVGIDGDPRVVPIGFHWNGSQILLFTVPKSAKVRALRQNRRVAITIDTQSYPPHVLLLRGTASLETVDGVPADYVEASRKIVPPEQFAEWEAGVRALYEQMVCITIEPDWAKLLDFESTIPKAVEDLVRAYQAR